MIETQSLAKRFGRKLVLQDINLKIPKGEFLTLYGPNGAGKSTLLKILATLTKPTEGMVIVNGYDASKDPLQVRRSIGAIFHDFLLYDDLTAFENLTFYMKMFNLQVSKDRIRELLSQVELLPRMNDRVGTFSRGMKQRLTIARSILHEPDILLLDEPYTGLDSKARSILNSIVDSYLSRGKTIFMTTHDIERGYEVGRRLLILVGGEIVFDDMKENITLESFIKEYQRRAEAG